MCFNPLYIVPFFPMVTRGILLLRFQKEMKNGLTKDERDTESHRTYIMGLAGFSFSGLLALVVLDTALRKDYQLPIYYLFLSFLGYLFALNMQRYKFTRWRDHLANALMDMASLCLILSILGILMTQDFRPAFACSLSIAAIIVWLLDHCLQLKYDWGFLHGKEKNK
jgi:FtsH-binding integral membrane protein